MIPKTYPTSVQVWEAPRSPDRWTGDLWWYRESKEKWFIGKHDDSTFWCRSKVRPTHNPRLTDIENEALLLSPKEVAAFRRVLDKHPLFVVHAVLQAMIPLELGCHKRLHDDHDGTREGKLVVFQSQDGDMHVWVERDVYVPALRFRTQLGGGSSPHTHNALRLLAEAIRMDNERTPN